MPLSREDMATRLKGINPDMDAANFAIWLDACMAEEPPMTTPTFPTYDGQTLSWSLDLYFTWAEQPAGYPRLRAVIQSMRRERPAQLARERAALVRASFGAVFGHQARRLLTIVEEEMQRASLDGSRRTEDAT